MDYSMDYSLDYSMDYCMDYSMDYSIDYSIEFYNLLTNGHTLVVVKLLPRLKIARDPEPTGSTVFNLVFPQNYHYKPSMCNPFHTNICHKLLQILPLSRLNHDKSSPFHLQFSIILYDQIGGNFVRKSISRWKDK